MGIQCSIWRQSFGVTTKPVATGIFRHSSRAEQSPRGRPANRGVLCTAAAPRRNRVWRAPGGAAPPTSIAQQACACPTPNTARFKRLCRGQCWPGLRRVRPGTGPLPPGGLLHEYCTGALHGVRFVRAALWPAVFARWRFYSKVPCFPGFAQTGAVPNCSATVPKLRFVNRRPGVRIPQPPTMVLGPFRTHG